MIYTVTFNPSLDYVVDVERFQEGMVNRTKREQIYPGGKGVNVSMVLKNLGCANTALGFVAGFTGAHIEKLLKEQGVSTDFIEVTEGCSRINVKLRSSAETEINGQGPAITSENIKRLYQKLDYLTQDDILVLAGSIPDAMPASIYMDIMKYLELPRVVVDATKELLRNVLPYRPFLIKPNHHELAELFATTIDDKAEVIQYARKLQEMGAQNVLVSMAGDGAILIDENGNVYKQPAPVGTVINSVGAGDSMVAGFLAGYLETGDYGKAFLMGLCSGSASAFSETLATRAEVETLLKNLEKTYDS